MPNRLAAETSPYLLQHKDNPVDWYPWGDEAFARARSEDKAVLLSVGYSACHWCHVMERESFENHDIAQLMNDNFINIKVDREERPDVDAVYMTAVQALTGHGGWPMTVFLTPDGQPFWGGTYFPPEDRHGMPGFPRVLESLARTYREQRGEIAEQAGRITAHLQEARATGGAGDLAPELLDQAARALGQGFDAHHGGFGGAPKFPAAMALNFLLRYSARTGDERARAMVEFSLGKMANGGIYDQLGGGFHRYSVDAHWLVPHFEKMLYDNALLARLYLHAWQATGVDGYRRIVEETLDYVLREMTDPSGGLYSTQDADSEGEEGKFFVWTPAEIDAVVGTEAARLFNAYYGVTERGNFEGHTILNVARPLGEVAASLGMEPDALRRSLGETRTKLWEAREQRVHPGRDDKVLAAWNGMMLRTIAEAAIALERDDYHAAAVRNAEFLTSEMLRDGRLFRSWKEGRAKIDGYLEDYALVIDGLLHVHEITFEARWLALARSLTDTMLDLFWDEETGQFFDTARDAEQLVVRPRDPLDNATPSGNSVAASVLLRQGLLYGEERYTRTGQAVLTGQRDAMMRFPSAFGEALAALDFALAQPVEIALVGDPEADDTRALLREVYGRFIPARVLVGRRPDDEAVVALSPLMEGRTAIDARATVYVCQNYVCGLPATSVDTLSEQLVSALG